MVGEYLSSSFFECVGFEAPFHNIHVAIKGHHSHEAHGYKKIKKEEEEEKKRFQPAATAEWIEKGVGLPFVYSLFVQVLCFIDLFSLFSSLLFSVFI